MFVEPIIARPGARFTQVIHLPDHTFRPGWYWLALMSDWSWRWASVDQVAARVLAGGRRVGDATTASRQPIRYATPPFYVARPGTLPVLVQIDVRTLGSHGEPALALQPVRDGCAIAPDAPTLDLRHLTVETWVYLDSMHEPPGMRARGLESEAPILGKGSPGGYDLRLVGDSSNKIYADLTIAGKFSVGRAGFVPYRKWTHIAATYDGHEARIYLNGIPVPPGRDPHHEGTIHAKGAPLVIGCRNPGTPDQITFNGLITGVRVWNKTLSPDAIRDEAALHQLPDTSSGLVGSWSFQSFVHGKIPDLSGAGNDLTAKTLQRVPAESGSFARAEWMSEQANLLHTVRIERVQP